MGVLTGVLVTMGTYVFSCNTIPGLKILIFQPSVVVNDIWSMHTCTASSSELQGKQATLTVFSQERIFSQLQLNMLATLLINDLMMRISCDQYLLL